jgi:hypothetical protein
MADLNIGNITQPFVQTPEGTPSKGYADLQAPNPLGAIGAGMQSAGKDMAEVQYMQDQQSGLRMLTQAKDLISQELVRVHSLQGHQAADPIKDDNGQPVYDPDGNAITPADQARVRIQNQIQEMTSNATPGAKALLNYRLGSLMKSFTQQTGEWTAMQGKVANIQDAQGLAAASASHAAIDPGSVAAAVLNPPAQDQGAVGHDDLTDCYQAGVTACKAMGIDPASPAGLMEIQKYTTPTIRATVMGLMKTDPTTATAFWNRTKGQCTAEVAEQVQTQLANTQNLTTSFKLADQVTAATNPDGSTLNAKQVDQWIRDKVGDNPGLVEATRAEVERRDRAVQITQQESVGNILDMYTGLNGGRRWSRAQIQATPQWAGLSGQQHLDLSRQFDAIDRRDQDQQTPADLVAQYATFDKLCDDPKTLAGMSDAQIASYTATLGPDLTVKLLDAKRKAAGNLAQLQNVTFSGENGIPLRQIAAEYSIGVITSSMSAQDKQTVNAQFGALRGRAMSEIQQEQMATGRPLTPERKEEIVRGLLTDVKVKGGGWFGGDTKKLFQIPVNVDPITGKGGFMDLDATDAEKTQALDYLTRAGAPITPSNVWTMIDGIRKKASSAN